MTNSIGGLTNDLFEVNNDLEIINLEAQQLEQAFSLSEQLNNQTRQWQVYIQLLSLFAFEEWLHQREATLTINKDKSTVLQNQYANVFDAVSNLEIGNFKVCLLPSILLANEEVAIPRAVIDLAEYAAHFYVVVGVDEESEIAAVKGFLRYDQLFKLKQKLEPETDWNYYISSMQFNCKVDELLLYLQCLEKAAIPLPEISNSRRDILKGMQTVLLNLLPQVQNRPLWKVLNWEQGKAVLTTPNLLNWLYLSIHQNTATLTKHLSDLLQILTQQTIDVGRWIVNKVDDTVQTLSWELLPEVSALRSTSSNLSNKLSPIEELDIIFANIQRENQVDIPITAIRAYQDVQLNKLLRLYALVWSLPQSKSEWSLLLILKAIDTSYNTSSSEFTLRVSDQTAILYEEELIVSSNSSDNYIYIQLEGDFNDRFLIAITSETGETQTFSPLRFIR